MNMRLRHLLDGIRRGESLRQLRCRWKGGHYLDTPDDDLSPFWLCRNCDSYGWFDENDWKENTQ